MNGDLERINMYVIKMQYRVYNNSDSLSFIELTLSEDLKWYAATNDAASFHSPSAAVEYAKRCKVVENRGQLGSDSMPYIVGPKGGKYSIFTGRIS